MDREWRAKPFYLSAILNKIETEAESTALFILFYLSAILNKIETPLLYDSIEAVFYLSAILNKIETKVPPF